MRGVFASRQLRRTDYVLVLSTSFLLGLVIARAHVLMPAVFIFAFAVAIFLTRRIPLLRLICIILFGLSLGIWRGGNYLQALQPYHDYAAQKVTLHATATLDAVYGKNGQLAFEVSHINFVAPGAGKTPGVMKVSGFGEMAVYRGDKLELTGKLYPTRGGKQATMSYATITRVASNQTWVDELRRRFVAGMQTALPEPMASFGLGLLIGQRNTLPIEMSQALLMVGLTHIIAVSGYNLTILLNASKRLLSNRSKRLTVLVGVGLMGFFLIFAGASPSIVRAAVISGLALAAWYFGRKPRPMVLLMLAAAITTYATPTYLWSDISWWLSFLAFFGILVIAPKILQLLYPKRAEPPLLSQVAVETMSAELMTIPLVMYIFGQVSLVGLLANMLVATVIPIAMLLSFIAGVAGMLLPLLAGWFAWPATLLLTYMLDTATLLSRIPHIFRENVYMSAVDMVLCYGVIGALLLFAYRPRKVWFDKLPKMTPNRKLR